MMDSREFYMNIIDKCEDLVHGGQGKKPTIEEIIKIITSYEKQAETFALSHERFAVVGLSIRAPEELFQIANHYQLVKTEMARGQKMASVALIRIFIRCFGLLANAGPVDPETFRNINVRTKSRPAIAAGDKRVCVTWLGANDSMPELQLKRSSDVLNWLSTTQRIGFSSLYGPAITFFQNYFIVAWTHTNRSF